MQRSTKKKSSFDLVQKSNEPENSPKTDDLLTKTKTPPSESSPKFRLTAVKLTAIQSDLISIADLLEPSGKVTNGKYLLCRALAPDSKYQSKGFHLLVDDPEGTQMISICMCYKQNINRCTENYRLMPVGKILAIKNVLVTNEHGDGLVVRCDDSSDVFLINDAQDLKSIIWGFPIPAKYLKLTGKKPGHRNNGKNPNPIFKIEKKEVKIEEKAYTRKSIPPCNNLDRLIQRLKTNFNERKFSAALKDADDVLQINLNNKAAIILKTRSLIALGKRHEALKLLENLTEEQKTENSMKLKAELSIQLRQRNINNSNMNSKPKIPNRPVVRSSGACMGSSSHTPLGNLPSRARVLRLPAPVARSRKMNSGEGLSAEKLQAEMEPDKAKVSEGFSEEILAAREKCKKTELIQDHLKLDYPRLSQPSGNSGERLEAEDKCEETKLSQDDLYHRRLSQLWENLGTSKATKLSEDDLEIDDRRPENISVVGYFKTTIASKFIIE